MPISFPFVSKGKESSEPVLAFPLGILALHEPSEAIVDIVFVHGLTGDREKTWMAKNAIAPWPQTLLPLKVPNARVLTFGYDAYVADWRGMVSKNRIGNHSWKLLTALATYREDDNTVRFIKWSSLGIGLMAAERPPYYIRLP